MNSYRHQETNVRDERSEAIANLTQALEEVIQRCVPEAPENISIFFSGTEVYRYQATQKTAQWWGQNSPR